ncbi:hypothetical protein K438DRAFT_351185 [Mycena galopus ATCC 62051]|nr:hypothetical protein K438DRAFT_351185 [Mycena galopus ATCC 62051]
MFALLIFCHLLISRKKCMLFPQHPYLSCSRFLPFSSLGRSACLSLITHPYRKIWNDGLLETWEAVNQVGMAGPFDGQLSHRTATSKSVALQLCLAFASSNDL